MEGPISFVQLCIARFNRDLSAVRHGVPCIHDEIHQYLLDLSHVGPHAAKRDFWPEGQRDVLANRAT